MAYKAKSKDDKFLKVPEYPGGKQALQSFINAHLQYPADALEQKLEGVVVVHYEVDDNGIVVSSKVMKGLSPSCNEEAIRVVGLLQYSPAFNHGIRVTSKKKVNIYFKLSQRRVDQTFQINYTIKEPEKQKEIANDEKSQESQNYTYSIYLK